MTVRLSHHAEWLVTCDHPTGCGMQVSVYALEEEQARCSAVARYRWTRQGDKVICRRHQEASV